MYGHYIVSSGDMLWPMGPTRVVVLDPAVVESQMHMQVQTWSHPLNSEEGVAVHAVIHTWSS
jgi:hypothetical protein